MTNAIEIADTAVISVVGDYATSFVAGDVVYSQVASITVSAAALDGYSITFTGAGFPTDGSFTAHASFAGIDA